MTAIIVSQQFISKSLQLQLLSRYQNRIMVENPAIHICIIYCYYNDNNLLFFAAKMHDLKEILEVLRNQSNMDMNKKQKLDNAVSRMFKDCAKQIIFVIILILVMYSNQDRQLFHQNNALRSVFFKHDVSCESPWNI